jgi:hypothetical protein
MIAMSVVMLLLRDDNLEAVEAILHSLDYFSFFRDSVFDKCDRDRWTD